MTELVVHAVQDQTPADHRGFTVGSCKRWQAHTLAPRADTSLWRGVSIVRHRDTSERIV